MRAVVLVGGFGTRLRPLTLGVPKQMLPVVHVTMLERVVAGLGRHGVTEAILALGYRPDVFIETFPEGTCAGVRLHYAVEPEPLDTAGAIRFAARHAGVDDTFVVVNGDVINDFDLTTLVAMHRRSGAEGTIHLTPVDDPSRYGVVPTDADGRVLGFIEKPPRDEAPTNWINAGTYVLEPSVLDRIPDGCKVSVERETFPAMVADRSLFALGDDCYWVDAGTPATYLQVQLDLLGTTRGTPEPGVHATAEVHPTAVIDNSVVGAGATIGAGAVVVDSAVLAGANVGPNARVEGSIVGDRATLGTGAKLAGLTVVGQDAVVAAGADLVGARVPRGALVKAVVTGGAGFIGSTLVDQLLAAGHHVHVLDDFTTGSTANLAAATRDHGANLEVTELDLRDPSVVEVIAASNAEVVFHLGAQIDVRVSVSNPVLDAQVNVIGSLHAMEGARLAGARKVVFASSGGTIYGEVDAALLPVDESHPQRPVSPYGVAKKVTGDYLYAYQQLHGLDFTALALANVYGPRQDPHGEAGVVAIFAGLLLDGKPCRIFGTGEQTRDFVYVDDVADAFVRAAAPDSASGLVVNIGTGVETSVNELYAAMATAARVDAPASHEPARSGELARSALSAERARATLGWQPQVDLPTGARRTLDWFRAARS